MDFVKRNVFWIAMGALVVLCGVAFAALALPARANNNKLAASIKSEANTVHSTATRTDLRNPEAVAQQKKKTNALQAQWQQALQVLQDSDKLIERRFDDPNEPGRMVDDGDAGTWKQAYSQQMSGLLEMLSEKFVEIGAQPIVQKDYQNTWPSAAEVKAETKRYWVQHYILSAIAALNREGLKPAVPVFGSFLFSAQPDRLLDASHETLFDVIPFELQLECEFYSAPLVMATLRNMKELNCYVTTVTLDRSSGAASSMQRGGRRGRRAAPSASMPMGGYGDPSAMFDPTGGGALWGGRPGTGAPSTGRVAGAATEQEESVLPSTLVRVYLKGYVADYRTEEEQASQPPAL